MNQSQVNFQSHQIVCLEYENTYLYSEVIQIIEQRRMCWVRPWVLAIFPAETSSYSWNTQEKTLYNLRSTADLVWPLSLFRPALDTEVIPLLENLDVPATNQEDEQQLRQQLNSFVNQLWQVHKAKFQGF
ncbi:MAG: hypothetical protein WA896_01435 [Spirulinaceae cyanobacterium]